MKKQGTVVRWDSTKGFGFIRSAQSTADIFFHIRDFRGTQAPSDGMLVNFEEIHVGGKGPRAMAVYPHLSSAQRREGAATAGNKGAPRQTAVQRPKHAPTRASRQSGATHSAPQGPLTVFIGLLTFLWLAALLWGVTIKHLPWQLLPGAAALNLLTFLAYWNDKSAAQRGTWRTPESTLHWMSLAGGWPAARLAQQTLRHKSSKDEFLLVYAVTAIVNTAGLLFWAFNWLPDFLTR